MSGAIPGDASGVSLIEQFIPLFNNLSPIRAKKATCDMLSAFFLLFLHQQPARCCYSVAGPCVWVHIINLNSYETYYTEKNNNYCFVWSNNEYMFKMKLPNTIELSEIEKIMSAHGTKFPECVTIEDITFTVNYLYHLFYPLIPDVSVALRFAEKYIKDENYPVKYGKPFCEWSHREWLREKHNKK